MESVGSGEAWEGNCRKEDSNRIKTMGRAEITARRGRYPTPVTWLPPAPAVAGAKTQLLRSLQRAAEAAPDALLPRLL